MILCFLFFLCQDISNFKETERGYTISTPGKYEIINCFFTRSSKFEGSGGVVYIESNVHITFESIGNIFYHIYSKLFSTCIFFSVVWGTFICNKNCIYDCESDWGHHSFTLIFSHSTLNLTSIVKTPINNNFSSFTTYFNYGYTINDQCNFSKNVCSQIPSIFFRYLEGIHLSFMTIEENNATDKYIISFVELKKECVLKYSNFIKNKCINQSMILCNLTDLKIENCFFLQNFQSNILNFDSKIIFLNSYFDTFTNTEKITLINSSIITNQKIHIIYHFSTFLCYAFNIKKNSFFLSINDIIIIIIGFSLFFLSFLFFIYLRKRNSQDTLEKELILTQMIESEFG